MHSRCDVVSSGTVMGFTRSSEGFFCGPSFAWLILARTKEGGSASMLVGAVSLPSLPSSLLFHALLLVHYALLRHVPASRAWIATATAVVSLFSFSICINTDVPFLTNYQRVVAV